MHRPFALLLLATILLAVLTRASSELCTEESQGRITSCLDQVERDESQQPGGPCSSSNWRCICTKQQGIADCYSLCPALLPGDAEAYDNANCAGQHEGIIIQDLGGTVMYSWSDLTVPLSGDQAVPEMVNGTAATTTPTGSMTGTTSAQRNASTITTDGVSLPVDSAVDRLAASDKITLLLIIVGAMSMHLLH